MPFPSAIRIPDVSSKNVAPSTQRQLGWGKSDYGFYSSQVSMKAFGFNSFNSGFLLGGTLMIYVGCEEKSASNEQEAVPLQEIVAEKIPYFSPLPGEVWKYRVEKAIPLGVPLSPADARRHTKSTDAAQLITFEQTRKCNGTRKFQSITPALTTIAILEEGKLLGEELYEIQMDGFLSWGWIPDDLKAEEAQLLNKGVPLAKASMRPGESWESNGREPGNPFLFKVIEREELTVPAGTFRSTRIQITHKSSSYNPVTGEEEPTSLKRSLWLARDVGILKEETVYYTGSDVTVKQTSELVKWVLPEHRNSEVALPANP